MSPQFFLNHRRDLGSEQPSQSRQESCGVADRSARTLTGWNFWVHIGSREPNSQHGSQGLAATRSNAGPIRVRITFQVLPENGRF